MSLLSITKKIFLLAFLAKRCLMCSTNEYSYHGSSCLTCSSAISDCVTCTSGQYSPITNGSFETPTIDAGDDDEQFSSISGWTKYPSNGNLLNLHSFLQQTPHDGSQMLELEKRYDYLYQDLATDSGQLYQISLYYTARKNHPLSEMQARIHWGSNIDTVSQAGSSDSNWQHYTATVTASASTTRLKLESIGTSEGNGIFFDSVSYNNLPTCTLCDTGFGVNSDNTCKLCSDYDARCVECSSTCTKCNDGYYLSLGTCVACPDACSICTDSSTCTGCKNNVVLSNSSCLCNSGTYLDTDQCETCSSKYADCTACNETDCTACSNGFFLSGGSCTDCPGTCTACTSLSSCSECKNDIVLNGGSCACDTGTYLDTISYTCNPCSDYHPSCIGCDIDCTACSNGFYTDGGSCSNCPSSCSICSSSSSCSECVDGFYLNVAMCEACPNYCSLCSSLTNCSQCKDGLYLNGIMCKDCPSSCSLCSSLTDCTECKDGFYLDGTMCEECPSSCSLCSSLTECTECKDGFYLDGTMCEECPNSCSLCSSLTECTECKDGFYLDGTMCETCPNSCPLCSSLTECTECKDGFYLDGTMCETCPSSCSLCSSLTNCTECKDRFYLNGTMCEECPTSCSKCLDLSTCTECVAEFFFNSGDCINCPQNCETCSDASTCLGCQDGYFVQQGECEECLSTCTRCSSFNNCSECEESFVLRNGKCETCTSSCKVCSEFLECLLCEDGFFLLVTSCKACDERCLKCSDESHCSECSEGYFLEEETCHNCFHTCSKCISGDECTECKSSFHLVSGNCICLEGDYFTEEGCRSCSQIHEKCKVCDSVSFCTECSDGFETIDGSCRVGSSNIDNTKDLEEEKLIFGISGEEAGNNLFIIGISLSIFLSITSTNPFALWYFLNLSTLVYFSPLMKTNMTNTMKDFCQAFGMDFLGLMPNFGELIGLKPEDYDNSSEELRNYEIESTSFFLNAGEVLFAFCISLLQFPFLAFAHLFCCKDRIIRILKDYKWNFFIRSWIQMYLEILVMAILAVLSLDSYKLSFESILSLFIVVLGIVTPFLLFFMILRYKDAIKLQNFEDCSTLFEEFKAEKSPMSVMHYPLFFLRRLVFAINIFALGSYPLAQVIINASFSVLAILYFLAFKPYKTSNEAYLSVGLEFFLIIIFIICGLCLGDNSSIFTTILEYSLIITVFAYFLMMCFLIMIYFIEKLKKRSKRTKSRTVVVPIDKITTSPNVHPFYVKRRGKEIIFEEIESKLDIDY